AIFFIQFRSAPAQKLSPAPASTTARTATSASSERSARTSSAISVSLNALWTPGRLRVTIAIALRTATSIVSYALGEAFAPGARPGAFVIVGLHPEDAERRRLDRRVERRRNRQPENPARVGGIDHAVIP